jgi:hypothetical protein
MRAEFFEVEGWCNVDAAGGFLEREELERFIVMMG